MEESLGRVGVFRALYLGDMLCSIPAIRSLRAAQPESEITLIGLPWASELCDRFSGYFDRFIAFPGYPGLPERPFEPAQLVSFLGEMRSANFDLILQMQGDGTYSNELVSLMGARCVAGFCPSRHDCADPQYFMPYPADIPEVRRHLALMEFLGFPGDDGLEFPLREGDFEELERLQQEKGFSAPYACVHPGARSADRRWVTRQFAAVADALTQMDLTVLLTGSREEAELIQQVTSAMQFSAHDLSGETSLGGLGALLSAAQLLVCNDTGVSHLAAAVATPSVVISTRSDQRRWQPLDTERHRFLINDPDSGQFLRADEVSGHAEELLRKERLVAAV